MSNSLSPVRSRNGVTAGILAGLNVDLAPDEAGRRDGARKRALYGFSDRVIAPYARAHQVYLNLARSAARLSFGFGLMPHPWTRATWHKNPVRSM